MTEDRFTKHTTTILPNVEKVAGEEQAITRHTGKNGVHAKKMIVVDQLWLWVIKGRPSDDPDIPSEPDLVITAFPERFNGTDDPSANVFKGIVAHLQRGLEPPLRSANDLTALVIEHCTRVFFQRSLGEDLWFLEFFAREIESVVRNTFYGITTVLTSHQRKRQNVAFKEFCQAARSLTELERSNAPASEISAQLNRLFAIHEETDLTGEILSIIEDLSCIDFIYGQQQDVLSSLTRAQKPNKFISRSLRQVCEIVKERRDTWTGIEQTARRAYGDLRDQMGLKQEQANVSEARSSRRQAEASAKQGRIMLLFTVITIIFLPMSFMASWFGMNAKGINDGSKLPLGVVAAIIFPISITIALFALVLAFSETLRNLVIEIVERVLDFICEVIGINPSREAREGRQLQQELMTEMTDIEDRAV
jgi:Mg2+ and Co2+ transporter CorA